MSIGDVNSNARGSGARYNDGKAAFELVPLAALIDCARVFDYGRSKYAEWNWAKGMPWSVPYACIQRHLAAWQAGEDTDPESGLPHLGHVMCNLVMLTTYARTYPEGDDRPQWLLETMPAAPEPDLREAVADLRETMGKYCECRAKLASDCPGAWEPGCDMGANDAHIRVAPPEVSAALDAALWIDRPNLKALAEGMPKLFAETGAKDLCQLVEILKAHADHADYLARWKGAPEEAKYLAQESDGSCFWVDRQPYWIDGAVWDNGVFKPAGENLLGSVRCEPRPKPAEDPEQAAHISSEINEVGDKSGVEQAAYLARWANAPDWAEWLSEDADGCCAWRAEKPFLHSELFSPKSRHWTGGSMYKFTHANLLGSTRCERRPGR